MAKTPPADRFSIDNQLLARFADLKSARTAYREACLMLAQREDDPERKHAVADLETEIKGHELAIERLEQAKLAQSETSAQEADAARIQAARDAAKAVAATTDRIRAALERLVGVFETTIGPTLAELSSLQRERAAQAWAAASGALGRDVAGRSVATLDRLAGDSPLRSALLAAIVRSGIGAVGPNLTPFVVVTAPVGGVGTTDQALTALAAQATNLDAFLADAIEQAANPQPAEFEE